MPNTFQITKLKRLYKDQSGTKINLELLSRIADNTPHLAHNMILFQVQTYFYD